MVTPLEAVQGVLDLMETAGLPMDEWEPDVIVPHTNGYGCWFIDGAEYREAPSTAAISAEAILARIEARQVANSQPWIASRAEPWLETRRLTDEEIIEYVSANYSQPFTARVVALFQEPMSGFQHHVRLSLGSEAVRHSQVQSSHESEGA